jgi:hypothetical protein
VSGSKACAGLKHCAEAMKPVLVWSMTAVGAPWTCVPAAVKSIAPEPLSRPH